MAEGEQEEAFGDDATHELAAVMLEEVRQEIAHADEKASLLIGGLGIAFTLLATGFIEGGWSLNLSSVLGKLLWAVGGLAAFVSVGAAALAVWPRMSAPPGGVIAYWGHLRGMRSGADVARALTASGLREPERTFQQLMVLSMVAQRKYHNIRISMASAGAAVVILALALVVTR